MSFDELVGTAYSVLSAQGHICVLTSTEMVTFPNLATDFLAGNPIGRSRDVSEMPIRAVDAFLAGEEAILLIGEEKVVSQDIAGLAEGVGISPSGSGLFAMSGAVVTHPTHLAFLQPRLPHPTWRTTQSRFIQASAA